MQKLLKLLVARTGCFSLVDRGSGLQAAQRERDIGGDLGSQRGSAARIDRRSDRQQEWLVVVSRRRNDNVGWVLNTKLAPSR